MAIRRYLNYSCFGMKTKNYTKQVLISRLDSLLWRFMLSFRRWDYLSSLLGCSCGFSSAQCHVFLCNTDLWYIAITSGYGKHVANLTSNQITRQYKASFRAFSFHPIQVTRQYLHLLISLCDIFQMFYVQSLFYCFSMLLIRLAILLFYDTILFGLGRRRKRIIFIIISIVVGTGMGSVFTSIFQCTPIRYSWDKTIEGHCLDSNKHYMGGPVTSFLLDLIILILPLPTVWRIQLPMRKKLGVIFLLSIGGL